MRNFIFPLSKSASISFSLKFKHTLGYFSAAGIIHKCLNHSENYIWIDQNNQLEILFNFMHLRGNFLINDIMSRISCEYFKDIYAIFTRYSTTFRIFIGRRYSNFLRVGYYVNIAYPGAIFRFNFIPPEAMPFHEIPKFFLVPITAIFRHSEPKFQTKTILTPSKPTF